VNSVVVIGAGLAGCEAAWQLSRFGISVDLYEMKPVKFTPAHKSPDFAELVCSNSFRADRLENAVGLLKEELRRLGSLIMECADQTRVEAGGALAVDRQAFSAMVTERIRSNRFVRVIPGEVSEVPSEGEVIIASGPLTSDALSESIAKLLGGRAYLSFYDAAAPLVLFDSIDMDKAYFKSRYDRGTPDYINCPMDKEQYRAFVRELAHAAQAEVHGFEDEKVFEGCMPVEVMARRGEDTLRFGPMKPVGLNDPATGKMPYAVVQLRKDNAAGSVFNLVGFQTHLTFGEQKRVFSMIPGLSNAEFVRYGVMHRNTYLDSPRLLNAFYQLRSCPRISFAGQMTGVEGYVESTASGLTAGVGLARRLSGLRAVEFPGQTAIGALARYISGGSVSDFQPMNINFGIIDPLEQKVRRKADRYAAVSRRALSALDGLSLFPDEDPARFNSRKGEDPNENCR